METTQTVLLSHLHPNPANPRVEAGDVTDLALSIREQGIVHDILVRPSPEFGVGHFVIEDGFRRWVAAEGNARMGLGPETVQVRIRSLKPGENYAVREVVTSLVTTIHRTDLRAMEKAHAFEALMRETGKNQSEVARMIGVNSSTVGRYLSLLELAPQAQKRVSDGTLSVEDAIDAVIKHRAKARKDKGQAAVDPGWEPLYLAKTHPLAKKARTMCDAREHNNRRRLDGVACGQCFETVIRQDQSTVDRMEYNEAFKNAGLSVPFTAPIFLTGEDASKNGQP
jgi:ParB family chromosome partitioning protein